MFSRRKRLIVQWLVLMALAGVLVACAVFVISAWWERRLNLSLAEWQRTHSDKAAQKVMHLLEGHRYGASGNKALENIIAPNLRLRRNYLAGRRVFASLECDSVINPRHLLSQYLMQVSVGDQTVYRHQAQGSLNKGVIANFQFTNGLRSNLVALLVESGEYRVVVALHVELLPRPGAKWRWPSSRSMPWKLLPERTGGPTGKPLSTPPVYKCEFVFPADIELVLRGDLDPVDFVSSDELDRRVREAFSIAADSSRKISYLQRTKEPFDIPVRNAFTIKYDKLPANIAFRTVFRERNGKEHRGSMLGSLKRAGESGVVSTFELYYDLLSSLPPGHYEGDIILETDKDAAYEFPGVTSLWYGTLTLPVSFFIDPPKRTSSTPKSERK